MKKHDNLDKDITYHCPMEACDKKYSNKAKLRQHIVKHFPGTLKPEDAAQLDIVPLFKNDEEKVKETVVQTSAVTVKSKLEMYYSTLYHAMPSLTFPKRQTLDSVKLKEFADDSSNPFPN